jgi:paraquat-inducible protein A
MDKDPVYKLNIDDYWGCPCCDLLVKKHRLNYQQKANCPRCDKTLAQPVENSIEKTLALSIGALILFFPAILLPLMTLNFLGFSQYQSIIQSITIIYSEKYALVAGIILITCVIIPFVKIIILFYLSLILFIKKANNKKLGKFNNLLLPIIFRIYHSIDEWGMLEIYLLGILVSVVKLKVMAELNFNMGLIIFALLSLLILLSSLFLDEELFWKEIVLQGDSLR